MKTRYPDSDAAATRFTDAIWNAASKVADKLDPEGEREIISYEPAVEEALEEFEMAGRATVPMAEVVKRAIEIEQS